MTKRLTSDIADDTRRTIPLQLFASEVDAIDVAVACAKRNEPKLSRAEWVRRVLARASAEAIEGVSNG